LSSKAEFEKKESYNVCAIKTPSIDINITSQIFLEAVKRFGVNVVNVGAEDLLSGTVCKTPIFSAGTDFLS
jgi:hypothetical protein